MNDKIDYDKAFREMPDEMLENAINQILGITNGTDPRGPVLKPVLVDIFPIFVIQYALLALFGIVTNAAIIVYIMRYKLYRDVTHAFIVNLAFCQFFQCVVELPITLSVLLIRNWVFGQFWCFFLPLLQVSGVINYI